MYYFIGWALFLIFFKLYLNFKVVGRQNVPKKGAFIFASNHTSYFDPIMLGTSLHRSMNYMAREDLFKGPFFDWVMRKVHAFPVKRGAGDLRAIRDALRMLDENKPLVIFPEGTRSKDRNLRRGKPGIGFITARSGVPVVPAYIEGSFEALPGGIKTLKRRRVKVYIGKSVDFSSMAADKDSRDMYQQMSDEIMKRIAQLKEDCEASQTG